MATSDIQLIDGDGIITGNAVASYDGVGDGEVSFTAEECVGLDREGEAMFSADGCESITRTVFQLGLREEFTDRDFLVADGGTFHVLKDASVLNNYYEFVGSDEGDSVVTIDGVNISVPSGATVKGYFKDDISAVPTNNLKKIKIIGDVSLSIGNYLGTQYPLLESIELNFSENYSRSLQYFCYYCTGLKKGVVKSGKPTSMSYMFFRCNALTALDVSNWNTSKVTTMQYMFYHCESLPSIDVSNWDTSKVTSMVQMFGYCYSLISLDLSSFNTSSCTEMNGMFREELALVTLDLSSFNTSKVTAFNAMFRESYALTNLYLGDKWDMGSATNVDNMFLNCTSLANVTGTISNLKLSFDLSYSPLTRESALVFINGLSSEASGQTLTLSSTTKALLTDEDIAIATDKGWTIA